LYFNYGPAKLQPGSRDDRAVETPDEPMEETPDEPNGETPDEPNEETPDFPAPETTSEPELDNAILHIGFHDIFIEGEYLTVCSK
jgi:hypothetical protein